MYPRNAASPERIAIGAVVLIADGTVQTSGVSVSVVPQGGAAGAGGGTIAYEQGIVHYIPTQAETNYASFLVIAYKASCIPVSVTVVTSASATAGYAGVDWSKVTAPTTTLALTGTTIAPTQKVDVETIKTQAVTAAAGVTFPTSIASPTNITAGTITTVSGNVNGNVAGSVGSVTGFTPADITTIKGTTLKLDTMLQSAGGSPGDYEFAADALRQAPNSTGPTAAAIAGAVWDEAISGHLTSGTTGAALNAAGSAGDPWSTPLPGAYGAGTAGFIVADILGVTDKLDTTLTPATGSPGEYQFTADALRAAPTGSGGGSAPSAAAVAAAVWAEALPGGYGAGQAGKIVGDNVNATISSRATQTSVDTMAGYVDTEVAAILAAVDTEVAAIKAKTDNLPAAPAATGDIPTAAAVADAIWDEALSGHVTGGSAGAALRDADLRGSRTVIRGTVGSATTPSTTQFTPSALTPAGVDANQFQGRIIVWDNDTTTTALRGEATDITASSAASLPLFTFTALTSAPQSGDTFSIV